MAPDAAPVPTGAGARLGMGRQASGGSSSVSLSLFRRDPLSSQELSGSREGTGMAGVDQTGVIA